MRKVLSLTLILLFASATFLKWGTTSTAQNSAEEVEPKIELVDIKADVVFPHKLSADSSVLCLVGNFAAQHHGAIITADSAVRYGNERIDCFGNVLINKNTTYAYADRAVYNSTTNEVWLYSPLVKILDEGVTLYTYNFKFNTLTNIGEYWGGGVSTNQDSTQLESMRGFYYADTKDVIGVEAVEIYTTDYEMKGDSVRYNMDSGYAEFFDNSNIWSTQGDYLYSNRGDYDKDLALFKLTRDGYMLSSEQEAWCDTLDYFKDIEEAIMRSNIQVDDTVNKMLIYSDFAHYWGVDEKIFLSQRPSIVGYDPEQNDTMFMRADTIIITTHNREAMRRDSLALLAPTAPTEGEELSEDTPQTPEPKEESRAEKREERKESKGERGGGERGSGERGSNERGINRGSDSERGEPRRERSTQDDIKKYSSKSKRSKDKDIPTPTDTLSTLPTDSLAILAQDSTTIALEDSIKTPTKEEIKRLKAEAKRERADSISLVRVQQRAIKLDAQKARIERKEAERKAKIEAKMLRRGKEITQEEDCCDHDHHHDSVNSAKMDSLQTTVSLDSLSMLLDSLGTRDSSDMVIKDSIYRIIVGFRDSKTLQGEQQTASDSLSLDLSDTTLRLYINPFMWNAVSQVQSEVMDIYTKNGEVDRAVFTGSPIMASMITPTHFNQVAGRTITSIFKNNEIERNEVEGNVQTIYFMQEDDTQEISTMTYVESGTATFYFENRELEGITYRSEPVYTFFPIDLIPATQSLILNGFEWEGRERPTRMDFTDRVHRPSIRKEKESLPRPEFPIQQSILLEKVSLIRDRRWMDRDDQVSSQAEEWLESLGYKSGQPRESGSTL